MSIRTAILAAIFVTSLIVGAKYVPMFWPSIPSPSDFTEEPQGIVFDFDSGFPVLVEGQNTPLSQTSNGLTAIFTSPSDSANPVFSIQSYDTTFFKLPQFSGRWLYDNRPSRDMLMINFSRQLSSINFTFSTREYDGGPSVDPTNIALVAYMDSTDTTPVGSVTAHGTFSTSLYPQGTLAFNLADQQFNLVTIEIPFTLLGATDFLVDNIIVTTARAE